MPTGRQTTPEEDGQDPAHGGAGDAEASDQLPAVQVCSCCSPVADGNFYTL